MTAPESPWGLPTPREAMREAVEAAQRGEWPGASVWLGIARELRVGRQQVLANEWDDAAGMPAPCQPIGCDNGYHLPGCYFADLDSTAGEPASRPSALASEDDELRNLSPLVRQAEEATGMLRMGATESATAVFELPHCAHCGHVIEWHAPGPDEVAVGIAPDWRHSITMKPECPVSAPDQPRTYAMPRVDARG